MSENATAQAKVPTELWCLIWSFLAMEDTVAVSQTCSAWRYAAFKCPELWCEVDFASSLHSDDCACIPCERGEHGCSNLALVREVLSRSAELLLTLTVHSLHDYSNFEELDDLIALLIPNTHRLRGLRFLTSDETVPSYFLSDINAFPALRTLIVLSDQSDQFYNAVFHDAPMVPPELPVLRDLEIRGCFFYTGTTLRPTPMLELSSLALGFSYAHELADCLTMCPRLESLRLHMPQRRFVGEPTSNYDRVRIAMNRPLVPIAVDIFELSQPYEDIIRYMFDTPAVKKLRLSYAPKTDPFRHPPPFGILRVIERPAIVSVSSQIRSDGEHLVVLAQDDNDRERSVAVPHAPLADFFVSEILVHVSVHKMLRRTIFVDVGLWNAVVLHSLMLYATTCLILSFAVGGFDRDETVVFDAIPELLVPMDSLRELRITTRREAVPQRRVESIVQSWKDHRVTPAQEDSAYRPIRIPPGYLRRFIKSLRVPTRLQILSVDPEVELEEDVTDLEDLATTVCYK